MSVMTTVEELDALPEGSIVIDASRDAWECVGVNPHRWRSNTVYDDWGSAELGLPARILIRGDER